MMQLYIFENLCQLKGHSRVKHCNDS